jgi:SOS-response transcriptional repressor LexA
MQQYGGPSVRIECVNPILNVANLTVSRNYYVNVLGFTETGVGELNRYVAMRRDGAVLYLNQQNQASRGTWVWIGFDGNISALYKEFKTKGAIIRLTPTNYSWAMEMHVEDPDGHVLRFGTDPNIDERYADE